MDLRGKRLLLLGGNLWAEAIAQYAKAQGIVLIAAGNNPSTPTFYISDEQYPINTTDAPAMARLIIEKKIDGVYPGATEPVIEAACHYVNEAGLPFYCNQYQWSMLQNKENFKQLCRQFGLPTVTEYTLEELQTMPIDNQPYPVVVKPVDGSGSNGVVICSNYEETAEKYREAVEKSFSGRAIIEKYVKNTGFCALYTLCGRSVSFSALEYKQPVYYKENGSFVGGIYLSQSAHSNEFRELFDKKISDMLHSLQILAGNIWMEVFYDGTSYYFNEAGFRYGGEYSMYPVDYFCNYNQIAADMYFALTGECAGSMQFPLIGSIPKKQFYCAYPLHMKAGKITSVLGLDELSKRDNIVHFFEKHSVGDVVKQTGTFGQIFGFCHFLFDTKEELWETLDFIHKHVLVLSDEENLIDRKLDISTIPYPF